MLFVATSVQPFLRMLILASAALLVVASPGDADVLTFQSGDGGAYSTSEDTFIQQQSANTVRETYPRLLFDNGPNTDLKPLVRFPDVFGAAVGQIPFGSTINSCTLTLEFISTSTSSHGAHAVLADWDVSTVTWNNFGSSPGGVSGVDYDAAALDTFTPNSAGSHVIDLTSLCQDWSNGTINRGVILINSTSAGSECHSDNAVDQAVRPLLTVDFTPGTVAVTPSTWSFVKSLY